MSQARDVRLSAGGQESVRKGVLPPVQVTAEKRSGNKVTCLLRVPPPWHASFQSLVVLGSRQQRHDRHAACHASELCPGTADCSQKVTRIVGVETFLLEPAALAADLQKHFAASATVAELPGSKSKGVHEVVLQVFMRTASLMASRCEAARN